MGKRALCLATSHDGTGRSSPAPKRPFLVQREADPPPSVYPAARAPAAMRRSANSCMERDWPSTKASVSPSTTTRAARQVRLESTERDATFCPLRTSEG